MDCPELPHTKESESCEPDLLKPGSGVDTPDETLPPSGDGGSDLQGMESLDTVVDGVDWQEKMRGSDVRKEIIVLFGSTTLDCGGSRSGVLI